METSGTPSTPGTKPTISRSVPAVLLGRQHLSGTLGFMVADSVLEALRLSDQHAIRTVDSLTDEQWVQHSVLPGWTRAHVVAHLALNAEGFTRALEGLQDGMTNAIYDSQPARDAAIEDLAVQDPGSIRDRFFGATTRLRHTFGGLTETQWDLDVHRTPDAPGWRAAALPTFRRREVEIHHADLGCGYSAADWPMDFIVGLLDLVVPNHRTSNHSPVFAIEATDVGQQWSVGAEAPVVSGAAYALAWWLVGRGNGEGLTTDRGPLPVLGPWARP